MILAFLATKTGQTLAVAIGGAVLWGVWLHQHDKRVIEKHEVRVEKEAEKKNARSNAARGAVTDANVGGLLSKYYRD